MRFVTRTEFDEAAEAVWQEIQYQNNLARRTDDSEAKDVPGFLTLFRRYERKAEAAWSDEVGNEAALHMVRKLAGIAIRAMVYCGVRGR